MRYFLKIAYQGTRYHGWQVQANAVSVQECIEKKLTVLFSFPITLTGSSRTDTGVHAQEQWAHLDLPFLIDGESIQYRLNTILPPDIAITGIYLVYPNAHARFSAISRTYRYSIVSYKDPFLANKAYFFTKKLDRWAMNQAATFLLLQENFETFSKLGTPTKHGYTCSIVEAFWYSRHHQLIFQITSNRFLRGMVRGIVGHLLKVGLGKCSVADFEFALKNQDRRLAANLAPANGLTLFQVRYPAAIFID